jgi:DNA-binding MarR family transcriptional regulator
LESKRIPATGLNSVSEHNPLYSLLKCTKLYSQKVNITQRDDDGDPKQLGAKYEPNPEILTDLGVILGDRNLRRLAFYALDTGAITLLIAKQALGLNHTAASRAVDTLEGYGILTPSLPIKRPRGAKGGRRVTVYQTPEASVDQVAQACELQRRLEAPKYRVALRYTQALLEEYFEARHREEITYVDLLAELKERRVPEAPDVANLMVPMLRERGVKVWR